MNRKTERKGQRPASNHYHGVDADENVVHQHEAVVVVVITVMVIMVAVYLGPDAQDEHEVLAAGGRRGDLEGLQQPHIGAPVVEGQVRGAPALFLALAQAAALCRSDCQVHLLD